MAQVFGFEKDFQDYFRKEISKTVLEKVRYLLYFQWFLPYIGFYVQKFKNSPSEG
jgi:hypothetical protein